MSADLERKYLEAVKALNEAAYAALRAAKDTDALPMVNRQMLREMALASDAMVNAGLGTAVRQ